MSINVLPHKKFDEWMADFQLDDSHPPMPDEAVISICCTPDIKHNYLEGHKHETDEHWFKQNHSNVLNIDFDDITCPVQKTKYGTAYGITDEQADTIVRFINDHIETDNWYIVSTGSGTGYISKSYLSTSAPAAAAAGTSGTGSTGTSGTSGSSGSSGTGTSGSGALSGTVTGSTADTITVLGDDGNTYTVYTGEADITTTSGLYSGLYVNVSYSQNADGSLSASYVSG